MKLSRCVILHVFMHAASNTVVYVHAFECFQEDGLPSEIHDAVEDYADDPSSSSAVALRYGWPIGTWCVGRLTTLHRLFDEDRYGRFEEFNEDISSWDVSSVTSMRLMFRYTHFNRDISAWDTSSVVNLSMMFYHSSFNQDIGRWDTSRVENMDSVFWSTPFNHDISRWITSRVTAMSNMFYRSRFNQDISGWDVSRVTITFHMFEYSDFNQNLCAWGPQLQGRSVNVGGMFLNTNCPTTADPDLTITPPGPFCYPCGPTPVPSVSRTASPTQSPVATAPPTQKPSLPPTTEPTATPSSSPSSPPPTGSGQQDIVVPPELENELGTVTRYFSLPIVTYPGRTQQVYSVESLGTTRKKIKAVSFRYTRYPPKPFDSDMIIRIGTTSLQPDVEMSKNLDDNMSNNMKLVYDGSYSFVPGVSSRSTNPFDVHFELEEPIVFDPSLGANLLIDLVTSTDVKWTQMLDQDNTDKMVGLVGAAFVFDKYVFAEKNMGLVSMFTVEDFDPQLLVEGVKADLHDLMDADNALAARLVRLSFHDCIGGCDGCLDMSNKENKGMGSVLDLLDPIVAQYEGDGFTRADIWALAGLVAAEYSQPRDSSDWMSFDLRGYGRQNCDGDYRAGPSRFIPNSHQTTSMLLDFFRDEFGFSAAETVAIMGAHTLGRARQDNSGFEGENGWVTNPTVLDNEYYKVLLKEDANVDGRFMQKSVDNSAFEDFPNQFWWRHQNEDEDVFMLNADMAIAANFEDQFDALTGQAKCSVQEGTVEKCQDVSETRLLAYAYRQSNIAWLTNFHSAFEKMIERGYIYTPCRQTPCLLQSSESSVPTTEPTFQPTVNSCPCEGWQILCRLRNRCLLPLFRDE